MNSTISYTSFYWTLGTTSFRTSNFNLKIERQLELLSSFWQQDQAKNQNWSRNEKIQEAYYDFLKVNDFVAGDALRKAKDARQKTSGLFDIGLIDKERKLRKH